MSFPDVTQGTNVNSCPSIVVDSTPTNEDDFIAPTQLVHHIKRDFNEMMENPEEEAEEETEKGAEEEAKEEAEEEAEEGTKEGAEKGAEEGAEEEEEAEGNEDDPDHTLEENDGTVEAQNWEELRQEIRAAGPRPAYPVGNCVYQAVDQNLYDDVVQRFLIESHIPSHIPGKCPEGLYTTIKRNNQIWHGDGKAYIPTLPQDRKAFLEGAPPGKKQIVKANLEAKEQVLGVWGVEMRAMRQTMWQHAEIKEMNEALADAYQSVTIPREVFSDMIELCMRSKCRYTDKFAKKKKTCNCKLEMKLMVRKFEGRIVEAFFEFTCKNAGHGTTLSPVYFNLGIHITLIASFSRFM